MKQFVIKNLDEDVYNRLQELALIQGCSIGETAREILRNAILLQSDPPKGLGTRLAERFAKYQLTEELPELPRQDLEPSIFEQ